MRIILNGKEIKNVEVLKFESEKEEALAALEKERMEDLDNHLDMDFIKAMDLGEFDEELETEYGDLF